MSTTERLHTIIDEMPMDQQEAWLIILEASHRKQTIEETEPDEWDLEMIKQAEKENDGEKISLESLAKELGIDHGSL
ncbi:MAG: hypothetical protein J1F11_12560 [Oscillospiraceae bacterium]|nr:hypothetical protein [Oscillospiraceae bacterium]